MADRRSMIAVTRILVCLCLCLMMLMHLGIAKNGFDDNNFHPICDHSRKLLQSPPPHEPSNSAKKGALKTVLLIGLGGVCGFIGVGCLTLFLLWFAPWLRKNYNHFKNKRLRSPEQRVVVPFRSNEEGEGSSWYAEGGLSMRMSDLLTATNDFHKDRIIGYGGFGLVYKAFLPQGKVVAVKKLSMDACQGMREFQAEVEALAGIHHKHLVEILGYCKSGQDRLLVYRFVENGSLDEWLHEREDPERVLDWKKRLKIIRGVAAGLSFLHHDIQPHIIHRDIKASNILLDNDFEALITDFGLARQINPQKSHISTQVAGSALPTMVFSTLIARNFMIGGKSHSYQFPTNNRYSNHCILHKQDAGFSNLQGWGSHAYFCKNDSLRSVKERDAMGFEPRTSRFVGVVKSGMGRGSGGIYGGRRRRRRRTSRNEVENFDLEDEGGVNDDSDTNCGSDEAERRVRASDGLEDEELIGNPEMKSKSSSKPEDTKSNTQNKLSSQKNLKDKQDSAVNATGQVDSERQQKTSTKLNDDKTPVAKRLNKDKSSKGLKTPQAAQPSFREVAPVAETILTNPEIFDSSLPRESQEQGCENLKGWEHGCESKGIENSAHMDMVSKEPSAEKDDISNKYLKGISLVRPQTQSTQQSGDAVCSSDNIPQSEKPKISSKHACTSIIAIESRTEETSSKMFEQKSTNHKGVDDENSKIAWVDVEDCPGEDAVIMLRDEAGSKDIDAQVNPEAPMIETAHGSKSNTEQRNKEMRDYLQLPPSQNSQAGTEVDEANNNQEKVAGSVVQVAEQVVQIGQKVINQVSESLPDPVMEHVGQVAEHVSSVAEQVATTAGQVTDTVSSKLNDLLVDDEMESEDEFEAYKTSDLPEFKGMAGIKNFTILQEDKGVMTLIYDFYTYMLKSSLPEFALAMFAAPILLSMIFTLLYLPEIQGLALEETARQFFQFAGESKETGVTGLQLSRTTLFQVFMFSVSLSTGLQPELAPLSPYTLVVANLNALIAQLIFVFMSGAVFARLSQPSQPIRFSNVALVYPNISKRRQRPEGRHKVLMARYVLAGPQPCELVDVKVDLTYKYNTVTSAGTFFRATQSLKLVRTEIAYLNYGMLVRHAIDETSPLYQRTPDMLKKEDAIFVLSVVGLERSSMQPVFHVQHYCVYDGDVIWDAEFEDMILISQKNKLIMDHSKLSEWRPVQKMQATKTNVA